MRQKRILMGMPITVEIADTTAAAEDIARVFQFFKSVDARFSTYKQTSEISQINRGEIVIKNSSSDMQTIFALAQKTKEETHGYFNIKKNGHVDPSGIVKGWAIYMASKLLKKTHNNFYIEAGGDIQVSGKNATGEQWRVGIKNPFDTTHIVKTIRVYNKGVATSGTYSRGQHIYNPFRPGEKITDIVSLTVIGPNILEADRFATAVFAMGKKGIYFLESQKGLEGYMIDSSGIATQTTGFEKFVSQ